MNEYGMQCDIIMRLRGAPNIEAVANEVGMAAGGGYYADICYIESGLLVALELKLTYCERAIEQAKNYLFWGADKAYVVTPHKKRLTQKAKDRFRETGIGLMFYREPVNKTKRIGNMIVPIIIDWTYPLEVVIEAKATRPDSTQKYHDWAVEFVKWQYGEHRKEAEFIMTKRVPASVTGQEAMFT